MAQRRAALGQHRPQPTNRPRRACHSRTANLRKNKLNRQQLFKCRWQRREQHQCYLSKCGRVRRCDVVVHIVLTRNHNIRVLQNNGNVFERDAHRLKTGTQRAAAESQRQLVSSARESEQRTSGGNRLV